MISKITNSLILFISLMTASGVFMHDTRLDEVAVTAVTLPGMYADSAKTGLAPSDPHTHVERMSVGKVMHELTSRTPRVAPRSNEEKRHLMQNRIARGHHAFDNYNLPIV